jgi:hypothetical protein
MNAPEEKSQTSEIKSLIPTSAAKTSVAVAPIQPLEIEVYTQKVAALSNQIDTLKKNGQQELEKAKSALSNFGLISSFGGFTLYSDRLVLPDRVVLALDSDIKPEVFSSGNIWTTTESSGGGSKTKASRVIVGTLIAGPLGGVVGGMAKKKNDVKIETQVHDDRVLRVQIVNQDGHYEFPVNADKEHEARDFISKIINATINYPKVKDTIEIERGKLQDRVTALISANPVHEKEQELQKLKASVDQDVIDRFNKTNKFTDTARNVGVFALVGFWIPIVGLILSPVGIFLSTKSKELRGNAKTIQTGLICSIIGGIAALAINIYYLVAFVL